MNIKAAIFDVDGTLINSLIIWDVLWKEFGKRFLNDETFRPSAEDDKKIRTLTLKDGMQLIHDVYAIGGSGEELLAVANELIVRFYGEEVEVKSGVKSFLEHCRNSGVKLCIASATAADLLEIALKRCGLDEYFLQVFSCADLGFGKERPDIFLQAQAFLETDVSETWVFEDSLTAIETATKLGMPTVGIYDACNFGAERIREIATVYIAPGETLEKII